MKKKVFLKNFLDPLGKIDLHLKLIAGEGGLSKEIKVKDINRPGLTMAGFYDFFAYDRIQLFGLGETAFIRQLSHEEKLKAYDNFFSYDVLCCVFTHEVEPDEQFVAFANKNNVPVFISSHGTTRFTSLILYIMEEIFADSVTKHATLVDVYGIGVLLMGSSGVGKSECALELIERGHRLVGDDMIEIKKVDETLLMGTGSEILKYHMEIRGLGIINVRDIFGIRSVRNRKRIDLIAKLEIWDNNKEYDRLGIEDTVSTIMGIDVPYIEIPVRPGRNIPVIIETASLNQRLKKNGIFSAKELDTKLQNWVSTEK